MDARDNLSKFYNIASYKTMRYKYHTKIGSVWLDLLCHALGSECQNQRLEPSISLPHYLKTFFCFGEASVPFFLLWNMISLIGLLGILC